MASMITGGLFNAVAFAGAGFLFSKLNHRGYEKEMKRHNKALEKLAKAKEQWYEEHQRKKNEYMKKLQEYKDAKEDLEEGNEALDDFKGAYEEMKKHKETLQIHEYEKPTIHQFYHPSDEMKVYQSLVMGGLGAGSGWLVSRVV